jgi:hypothetical protein
MSKTDFYITLDHHELKFRFGMKIDEDHWRIADTPAYELAYNVVSVAVVDKENEERVVPVNDPKLSELFEIHFEDEIGVLAPAAWQQERADRKMMAAEHDWHAKREEG